MAYIARCLQEGGFLTKLEALPDNPSIKSQKAFKRCQAVCKQDDFARAEEFLDAALAQGKPLWNAHVYQSLSQTSPPDRKLTYLEAARVCLEDALHEKRGEEYQALLHKQWRKTSDEFLKMTLEFFEDGGSDFVQDFEIDSDDLEDFMREWYGEAHFRLAKFYLAREHEQNFIEWLRRGINAGSHESKNLLMEILWPLGDNAKQKFHKLPPEWNEAYGHVLAEELQESPITSISGGAHYRLYLAARESRHLRAAAKCDYPAAVSEYNQGVISISKIFRRRGVLKAANVF